MTSMQTPKQRKVGALLMPLYTRFMQQNAELSSLLQTVESADISASSGADSEKFAQLFLQKTLDELRKPESFCRIDMPTGLRAMTPGRQRNRKQLRSEMDQISGHLRTLFDRIKAADADVLTGSRQHSRLYNSIDYYRLAIQVGARVLEPMQHGRGHSSTLFQVLQLLRAARDKLAKLVLIPPFAIDQFDEKRYLNLNKDVRTAVVERHVHSGLEFFALHGVYESRHGGRATGGVDVDAIELPDEQGGDVESLGKIMSAIEKSGLFDAVFYASEYGCSSNALRDYCKRGHRQGRKPNPVFDADWYLAQNPQINPDVGLALYHYISEGEAAGLNPCEWFDSQWYRRDNKVADDTLALAHYLAEGRSQRRNPNAVLDVRYYARKNPDLTGSDIEAIEHFYTHGWHEHRKPSASFDIARYVRDEMGGVKTVNPVSHYLENKRRSVDSTVADAELLATDLMQLGDVPSNIHYFANAGPEFEPASKIDSSELQARAKTIAFYLPQFYAFEDNDNWWGEGFTEWRNVARGTPRYSGHYQPRVPRDLGFYNLTDLNTIRAQAEMARKHGIEAFCFYYYWFNGKRLMDKPLDLFADSDIDQEFCIMWANENWTRTWDGFDSEVLIEQNYHDSDEDAFIADTARYMGHERYIRVNGRPLFILYRPGLLPSSKETLARWRSKWQAVLGVAPWIIMVQGFDDMDPGKHGLDGAVEFPPHKICVDTPDINDSLTIIDPNFTGNVRSYADVIAGSLSEPLPEFPLIKTVSPHWDNDARREGRGFTLHGSTPALYEKWLQGAIRHAEQNPFEGEPLVFVNAWNEWAEGAYLEPDVHYGHAYLNATQRAVHGLSSNRSRQKILLVGHDAYRHGAQMLLLSIAKVFRQQFGLDVTVLLKTGGPLLSDYQQYARTVVLDKIGPANLEGLLHKENVDIAVCNTSVTGDIVPNLKAAGIRVVSLIHELPNLIREFGLEANVESIGEHADHVVFPSEIVQTGFSEFSESVLGQQHIQPQGTYKHIEYSDEARRSIRNELGIGSHEKLVLNAGYADLRKGFDLFLQTARRVTQDRPDVHFVWVGALAPDMKRWVGGDITDSELGHRIHLVGFTDKMSDYYSASDCLFLTSREDPYPTVVLEAMDVGMPVVLFRGATGFDSLMSEHGYLVDRNDLTDIQRALGHALYSDGNAARKARRAHVDEHCQFDAYCFGLLQLLRPDIKKVSVVVPNYNYAEYMSSRLGSVFDQTYPVFETIVLDDCSTDDSLAAIKRAASKADRLIKLVPGSSNSGNVFRQWRKGLQLSRGEHVWIAEADDLASPSFLCDSIAAFSDDTVMCFTDSEQIDTDGKRLAASYDYYYRSIDERLFRADFSISGKEFVRRGLSVRNAILNVSSVLWRRDALADALERVGRKLEQHKLVGDWRLYLEVLGQENSKISYIADSLNTHRRHEASVTHSMDLQAHLDEIQAMHAHVTEVFGTDRELERALDEYVEELREQFGLKTTSKLRAA